MTRQDTVPPKPDEVRAIMEERRAATLGAPVPAEYFDAVVKLTLAFGERLEVWEDYMVASGELMGVSEGLAIEIAEVARQTRVYMAALDMMEAKE